MASSLMSPGNAELYDRIVDLFSTRDVPPADRTTIRAEFGPDVTFDTLPEDVQQLILDNEKLPQVDGWQDDPDMPDEFLTPAAWL